MRASNLMLLTMLLTRLVGRAPLVTITSSPEHLAKLLVRLYFTFIFFLASFSAIRLLDHATPLAPLRSPDVKGGLPLQDRLAPDRDDWAG
eukprot:CAMPEP_0197940760 /NCGR_PEP_ID=MMETSP1439-20131203/121748_1 /TAXON_ID=66791 /ORGANISM="Gonyaulax spinifera, Strain CCMP409" /LENGTH=89 /DNA_ID=CAMNT_0043563937 /DNA_START=7 /DNA_END=272 /DNA_ORIENTATION=-